MSIYDSQGNNNITIRSKNIICDSIRRLNKINGRYEEIVSGGGGGDVELPYYLYGDQIKFSGTDLNLNAFYMNAVDQSINDLDAICTENLNRIIPLESEQVVQNNKISAVEAVNVTQGTKITALENKTEFIRGASYSLINIGYSPSSPRIQIDNGGLKVYSGNWGSATFPQIKIDASTINIASSPSSSVFLDYERIDNIAKLASVSTTYFNDKIDFTKKITFTGGTESTNLTNKKMVVLDSTSKELTYTDIPASAETEKILSHTPSLVDATNSGTIIAESALINTNEYTGDVSLVRKYNIDTVSAALLELTVTTAFDISSANARSKNLIFFKDDAIYNTSTGLVNKEKMNLSIAYLPSKDDLNSEYISVKMRPFPIRKNYAISGDQYALGRMIVVEKNIPTEVANKAVQLRGKFLIKKHISTGFFGEMNYGWTE